MQSGAVDDHSIQEFSRPTFVHICVSRTELYRPREQFAPSLDDLQRSLQANVWSRCQQRSKEAPSTSESPPRKDSAYLQLTMLRSRKRTLGRIHPSNM